MKIRTAIPVAAIAAAALWLAACSGSSSPTGTAASILGQAGATATGPPYTVSASAQGNGPVCDAGSAEADGYLPGDNTKTVAVCVFPSNAQLEHDAPGTFAGPNDPAVVQDGGAAIQVGQLVLVYVTNPGELDPLTAADVRPVVTGTGGTLLAGPGA